MIRPVLLTLSAQTLRAFVFFLAALLAQVCAAENKTFEEQITALSGVMTREIQLARIERFDFGDFALYVPATVSTVRGTLVALGGPDTRGFASDASFGAPIPEVEAALHVLGQELRTIAATHGLAVLGTLQRAMANGPESDKLILQKLHEAATSSGRAEIASAPLLLYGLSGGGPQAAGFTVRNPARVAGLFIKVPARVESLRTAEALAVPTYMVLAEFDAIVDNAALVAAFEANRSAGALWALAIEPGVPHHSLTASQRAITTNWMRAIVELRLGESAVPLRRVKESSGWLGNPVIGVAQWARYAGDRSSASWFPSQATAEEWKAFVTRNR